MSSPGTRAVADALTSHVRDSLDADNPIQGTIAAAPNWSTMTVPVRIDGVVSTHPFSNDYTPNVGELVNLRGQAGAKIVTDRVGGRADVKTVNAKQQNLVGDSAVSGSQVVGGGHLTQGDSTVSGDHAVAGTQAVGGDSYVQGWLFVDGEAHAYRVVVQTQVQADTVGCNVLGVGTVNATRVNGTTVGPQYGDSNGTHYGDQRGTCYGNIYQGGGVFSTDPSGRMYSANYYGGTFTGHGNFDNNYAIAPASSRHLKHDLGRIDGEYALETMGLWVPTKYAWDRDAVDWPPDSMDEREHFGLFVDEIDATAPEACHDYVVRYHNHPWDEESRDTPFHEEVIGRQYEPQAILGFLVAGVQQLTRDRDQARAARDADHDAHQAEATELREQIAALTRRVDQLEERTAA